MLCSLVWRLDWALRCMKYFLRCSLDCSRCGNRVGSRGNSRASTCSPSEADTSASVRADSTRAMNCIVWRRNRLGVAVSAATAIAFMFVLSGSSFLYATRVAPGKRPQLASPETAGPFGEIIRGSRVDATGWSAFLPRPRHRCAMREAVLVSREQLVARGS